MDRHNVILDDRSLSAARWLRNVYGLRSISAALRYAVLQQATQSGWRAPDDECASMPVTTEGRAS